MQIATEIMTWAAHYRSGLLTIVIGAVLLAGLDHLARLRRMQGYDAWWYFNLRKAGVAPDVVSGGPVPGGRRRGSQPALEPADQPEPSAAEQAAEW